jgi:hypothetical protein
MINYGGSEANGVTEQCKKEVTGEWLPGRGAREGYERRVS